MNPENPLRLTKMMETNNSDYAAIDVPVGNDFGQGDSSCVVTSNDHTDDEFQRQLSEELIAETVRLFIESPNTKDAPFKEVLSIRHLPGEILAHIFSFLDVKERIRNELVCRQWRCIGKQIPWTYPTKLVFTRSAEASSINLPITELNDSVLFALLSRCGSRLKEINLTSSINDQVSLTSKSVMTISLFCPNLEIITLHIRVTSACLETLARGCPNLKVVKIYNLEVEVHDAGIIYILRKCQHLEWLEVSDVCLAEGWFDEANPKLRKLCLYDCTIMPIAMKNLMNRCNCLEELHLKFCKQIEVDEPVLFAVFRHFKKTLKVLKIQCIDNNEDIEWCEGLKGLHSLEELSLEMCTSVYDSLLEILGRECPKLRLLGVPGSRITDEGLKALLALAWLKILDISCMKISGEGLSLLAERGVLEEVYLKSANINEACCSALAKFCPNLRILDVTGTVTITNNLVKEFAAAAQIGFFKWVVKLVVARTLVMKNDVVWEGLDVVFT